MSVTEGCRFCWMCRQACPVGHVTARETFTPHAWALTIESVKRGQLQWNRETVDVLYACADCGLCRTHCKTDRPLPDAIADARVDVAASGQAVPAVYDVDRHLRAHGNPYRAVSPTRATSQGPVALFVGDAAAHLGGTAVAAALRLLSAAGVQAVPIGVGQSTGLVASSLGLRETAQSLARAVLADVAASGCRELLVLSPGDRWAFEYVYPTRLGVAWPESVSVKDVTAVLADALRHGRLSLKRRTGEGAYGYHDPCHSTRLERDAEAPRELLAAVFGKDEGRQLFWRENRAHPCGATGGLEFTQPAIAAKLAAARVADAADAGATWLVTEDPSCLHHLAASSGDRMDVRGLYEILAEQV